jgi:hypothetical protein
MIDPPYGALIRKGVMSNMNNGDPLKSAAALPVN